VLHGDPAPSPRKGHSAPPIFGPCLLWPNGWMDQDAAWYGAIGIGPGHIVLDGDPAPPKKGPTPTFQLMSIVAKRSPILATAEHLFVIFSLWATTLINLNLRNLWSLSGPSNHVLDGVQISSCERGTLRGNWAACCKV